MMVNHNVPEYVLVLALLLLPVGLSGCVSGSSVEVPFPRLGDRVEFRETYFYRDGQATVGESSLVLDRERRLQLPNGNEVDVVQVTKEWRQGAWNGTTVYYFDRAEFGIVKSSMKCTASNISGSCAPVVHSFGDRGAPWGFGSSLLQGRLIASGLVLPLQVNIDDRMVPLEVRLEGKETGGVGYRVSVMPTALDALSMAPFTPLSGTFVVSEDNPYVQHAELEWYFLDSETQESARIVRVEVEQTHYEAGSGPVVARAGDSTPWSFCIPPSGTIQDLLPPGGDYIFPRFNSSFSEFVDYLVEHDVGFANHVEKHGSYIDWIRFSGISHVTLGDPVGLMEEMEFTATVGYPEGDGSWRYVVVEKQIRPGLLPLSESVSYTKTDEGRHPSVLPPFMEHCSIVSISHIAQNHENKVDMDTFLHPRLHSMVRLGQDGEVVAVEPRLDYVHSGPPAPDGFPQSFMVSEYDLSSGCLTRYEPGIRNHLS